MSGTQILIELLVTIVGGITVIVFVTVIRGWGSGGPPHDRGT